MIATVAKGDFWSFGMEGGMYEKVNYVLDCGVFLDHLEVMKDRDIGVKTFLIPWVDEGMLNDLMVDSCVFTGEVLIQ